MFGRVALRKRSGPPMADAVRFADRVRIGESDVADSARNLNSVETPRPALVRTFLPARVSYGDGAISSECTVNQLSDAGARLTLASSFVLPDVFEITIPQRAISCRAKLLWRKDDQVSVDFLDERDAQSDPTVEDHLARIRALEAENAKLKAQIGVLLQQVQRLTEA